MRSVLFLACWLVLAPMAIPEVQAQSDDASASERLRDGLTIGAGVVLYMGALDNNPENHLIQFLAQAQPSFLVAAERQVAPSLVSSLELSYDYVTGARLFPGAGDTEPRRFTNNAIALNLVGGYRLGLVREGFVRPFIGLGPMLLLNPTYQGFDQIRTGETRELGTRIVGNVTAGVVLSDQLRLGVRVPLTDYIDGWEGGTGKQIIDQLFFVSFGYRIPLPDGAP